MGGSYLSICRDLSQDETCALSCAAAFPPTGGTELWGATNRVRSRNPQNNGRRRRRSGSFLSYFKAISVIKPCSGRLWETDRYIRGDGRWRKKTSEDADRVLMCCQPSQHRCVYPVQSAGWPEQQTEGREAQKAKEAVHAAVLLATNDTDKCTARYHSYPAPTHIYLVPGYIRISLSIYPDQVHVRSKPSICLLPSGSR